MRATIGVMCACAVLVCSSLTAGEKPTETYQKAMKDLGVTSQALRAEVKTIESAGAYPDYRPLEKQVTVLRAAFKTTLAYWNDKKVDDAIKVTEVALKGVDDLEKAAKDKSYDDLVAASTAIGSTCATCHKAYRVQTPDGTYAIKVQY
jgi:cytochrome c556